MDGHVGPYIRHVVCLRGLVYGQKEGASISQNVHRTFRRTLLQQKIFESFSSNFIFLKFCRVLKLQDCVDTNRRILSARVEHRWSVSNRSLFTSSISTSSSYVSRQQYEITSCTYAIFNSPRWQQPPFCGKMDKSISRERSDIFQTNLEHRQKTSFPPSHTLRGRSLAGAFRAVAVRTTVKSSAQSRPKNVVNLGTIPHAQFWS